MDRKTLAVVLVSVAVACFALVPIAKRLEWNVRAIVTICGVFLLGTLVWLLRVMWGPAAYDVHALIPIAGSVAITGWLAAAASDHLMSRRREEHEWAIKELKVEHANAMGDLKTEHVKAIDGLKADHTKATGELKAEHAKAIDGKEARIAELGTTVAERERALGAATRTSAAQEAESRALEAEHKLALKQAVVEEQGRAKEALEKANADAKRTLEAAKEEARAAIANAVQTAEANRLKEEAAADALRPLGEIMHARAYVDTINYKRRATPNGHYAVYYRSPDPLLGSVDIRFGIEVAHYGKPEQRVAVQDIRDVTVKVWLPGSGSAAYSNPAISSVEERVALVGGTPYVHVHTMALRNMVAIGPEPMFPFCVAEVSATLVMQDDKRTLGVSSFVLLPIGTSNSREIDAAAQAISRALRERDIDVLDVRLLQSREDPCWRLQLRPCPSVLVKVEGKGDARFSQETITKVVDQVLARMSTVPRASEEELPIPDPSVTVRLERRGRQGGMGDGSGEASR
jgi:hypothetical protein